MSEEEQNVALGRAVVEYGATQKQLAAIFSEIELIAAALRRTAYFLSPGDRDDAPPSGVRTGAAPPPDVVESIRRIPSSEKLLALLEEAAVKTARKRDLARLLKQAGAEPAQ